MSQQQQLPVHVVRHAPLRVRERGQPAAGAGAAAARGQAQPHRVRVRRDDLRLLHPAQEEDEVQDEAAGVREVPERDPDGGQEGDHRGELRRRA